MQYNFKWWDIYRICILYIKKVISVQFVLGLASENPKLVEGSLRCLRTIFQSPCAPVGLVYQDEGLPLHLLGLVQHSVSNQVCVTTILTAACKV